MARQSHEHDGLIALFALAPLVGILALAAVGALVNWKSNLRPPKAPAAKSRGAPPDG